MGELKKWLKQKWVRIGTDGSIKGPCGTSQDKKNPDRCLPLAKHVLFLKKIERRLQRKKRRLEQKEKLWLKILKKLRLGILALVVERVKGWLLRRDAGQ